MLFYIIFVLSFSKQQDIYAQLTSFNFQLSSILYNSSIARYGGVSSL